MEPINWILFVVFFAIVIWKLFVQCRDAKTLRKRDMTDTQRPYPRSNRRQPEAYDQVR